MKISYTEHCRGGAYPANFSDSFSRMVMQLKGKTKPHDGPIGLTPAEQWSPDAVDFFGCAAGGIAVRGLSDHNFMERGKQEELVSLVPFNMISADHRRN